MSELTLANYYGKRASEYDAIYQKPEQQRDFERLRLWLQREVTGKDVVEIACGTGYWTTVVARSALSVVAIDINESMLQVARAKRVESAIQFMLADAYNLPTFPHKFTCGMAHFWLSHVPKQTLTEFLKRFITLLAPASTLLFVDSKYVEGYRKPLIRTDSSGNTYQSRTLSDGSTHEIIKNFLTERELRELFRPFCAKVDFQELDYLWALRARV